MKKRIPIIVLCCLVAVTLGLFLLQQDRFDRKQFDADLAVLRDYYSDDRDAIRAVAAWMEAHPEITGVRVDNPEEQSYIYTEAGRIEDFQSVYLELSALLKALPAEREHHFDWDGYEPQTVVYQTDSSLHTGRYCNEFWTSICFCFYASDPPSDGSVFYREDLGDGCWLVARNYELE